MKGHVTKSIFVRSTKRKVLISNGMRRSACLSGEWKVPRSLASEGTHYSTIVRSCGVEIDCRSEWDVGMMCIALKYSLGVGRLGGCRSSEDRVIKKGLQ
jgi:hypothetical protein